MGTEMRFNTAELRSKPMTIDTSIMKRKPDGTIDVAAELREVAGYLRVACPEQKTIIAHVTFLAQRLEEDDDL